jgi:diguanylate cyclase (GGDEF)-like protein
MMQALLTNPIREPRHDHDRHRRRDREPVRMLVIDDDPDLLLTVELQLQSRGFMVSTAASAAEGLDMARVLAPEVVLIDIGLPDGDGRELARTLREQPRTAGAGLIMLTARSDQGALRGAVQAGADDYVLKPYDLDELCSRIEMVRLRSARNLERNPLTGLPGNIVIRDALQRRIDRGEAFALAYVDIDRFKAINDCYGPERGDQVIRLLGDLLTEALEQRGGGGDFLGHIGGDDFIFLTIPGRVDVVCEHLFARFDAAVRALYNPADLAQGGIRTEDREGRLLLHPICTLSVGAATGAAGEPIARVQRAFELATRAKHEAKRHHGNRLDLRRATGEFPAVALPTLASLCADQTGAGC